MLKVILNSFLGILITVAGFFLAYLYLQSLKNSGQPLYLLLAFPLIIIGLILLIRASRADESLVISTYQETKSADPDSPSPVKNSNIMEKNNRLLNDWIKESEKRDKMKILEIAAAAEEDNEKNSQTSV
jgi:hypothetical protein